MRTLRDFQSAFVTEIWLEPTPSSAFALANQRGFAVYRNTVMLACIEALAANYPTVRQLVGTACFHRSATAFARQAPPSSGVLAAYGEGFATFLDSFDETSTLEYLPGTAVLDRFWTEAHFERDAPVLTPADLVRLSPEALASARFVPHPAARWRAFDAMPIYTIWHRHRAKLALDDDLDWRGEAALLTRPTDTVGWIAIPRSASIFMDASAAGLSFAASMDEATGTQGDDDGDNGSTWLPSLIRAGSFTRIESSAC